MSYHELSQETANACSRAVFDYDPDCYCAFHFVHADYPPRHKYRPYSAKYLQVWVWRAVPAGEYDRYVASVQADTGPELLRQLHHALERFRAGTLGDPSLRPADADLADLTRAVRHPLLPPHRLAAEVLDLAERMPAYETRALTAQLREGITERQRQAHQPPEGGGWVPSAPQTTRPLNPWSH